MKHNKEIRLLGICKYCKQEIYGEHFNKFQAHQKWCKLNPERDKASQQLRCAGLKGSKVSHSRKHQQSLINNEKHPHTLVCSKPDCYNTYIVNVSDKNFEGGYYPKFCSSKCAHSRILTADIKQKIGSSVAKEHAHICPECGKQFQYKGTAMNTWCDQCFARKFNYSRDCKVAIHRKYICNKRTLHKNDVPLHSSKCPECGKLIWSKTSDVVYCYDCAENLYVHVYQLYTSHGKKLVSNTTRKKLSELMRIKVQHGEHNGWKIRSKEYIPYSEQFWEQVLQNNRIHYEREQPVAGYLYRLDFVITLQSGIKIDLEIDGKQHIVDQRRSRHDVIRDKRVRQLGYLVYRVQWNSLRSKRGKMKMNAKIRQFLWWIDTISMT